MNLDREIVGSLTYRGILAYVACFVLGDGAWSTAQLAQAVSCNTSLMLEGLGELHAARPEIIGKQHGFKWPVGSGVASTETVQILDSKSARRQAFLDDIKSIFEWANKGLMFTMNAYDGVAVKRFLRTHSDVTQEEWRIALRHRFTSEGIVPGKPVHVWLDRLMEYLPGKQDKFGKLMVNGGGKLGEAITREQGNSSARREAVSAVATRPYAGANQG